MNLTLLMKYLSLKTLIVKKYIYFPQTNEILFLDGLIAYVSIHCVFYMLSVKPKNDVPFLEKSTIKFLFKINKLIYMVDGYRKRNKNIESCIKTLIKYFYYNFNQASIKCVKTAP